MASTTTWLKKIFSVGSISLVAALVGLYISYKTLLVDAGGKLSISYPALAGTLSEHGDCAIAINEYSSESLNELLPRFSNPSNYVLKDFYLRYSFSGSGFAITPTGDYELSQGRGSESLNYRPEKLAPGMSTEEPVMSFNCDGNDITLQCTVDASFNGCDEPFKSTNSYKIHYIPRGSQSVTEWYSKVERLISGRVLAIYSPGQYQELGVPTEERLSENDTEISAASETRQSAAPASQIVVSTANETLNDLSAPPTPEPQEIGSTEDSSNLEVILMILGIFAGAVLCLPAIFAIGCLPDIIKEKSYKGNGFLKTFKQAATEDLEEPWASVVFVVAIIEILLFVAFASFVIFGLCLAIFT